MDELARAIDARIQVDPQFKRYIDFVNQYNVQMAEWVKARKAGVQ